ncbi:MAG TPA: hypothetical protein VMT34_09940 [Aggregatilineales bacterium]|nr:hypothetical protein [Aggregatilineales bacterium]
MIVIMQLGATTAQVANVVAKVQARGMSQTRPPRTETVVCYQGVW